MTLAADLGTTIAIPRPRKKSALTLRIEEMRDAMPIRSACDCGESWEGTAGEVREIVRAHRQEHHPERPVFAKRPKRPKRKPEGQSAEDKMILRTLAARQNGKRKPRAKVKKMSPPEPKPPYVPKPKSWITPAREAACWHLYEQGLTAAQIAGLGMPIWGYANQLQCKRSVLGAFRRAGRLTRAAKRQPATKIPEVNRAQALAILEAAEKEEA